MQKALYVLNIPTSAEIQCFGRLKPSFWRKKPQILGISDVLSSIRPPDFIIIVARTNSSSCPLCPNSC